MSVSQARVAVVVPNWNGASTLGSCVASLLAQTIPADVVVVDNGSADGSVALLERDYPAVRIVRLERNRGFTGGVNAGIRACDNYEFVALFNNDAVADAGWAEALMSALDAQPQTGIATGLLLSRDATTIDSTGEQYSMWGLPFPRDRGRPAADAPPAGPTFGATGGATMYRRTMLSEIGLFDETFFAYYEDTDLSFRAQLSGYGVTYEPDARAYHEHGTTSRRLPGFTVYQTFKNLPLLFIKDVPTGLLPRIGVRFFCAYVLILANALRHGNVGPALRGVLRAFLLIPHALRERHRIQRAKHVASDTIASLLWPDLPPDQAGIRALRQAFLRKP